MLTKIIFVVVLIMPGGQVVTKSSVVTSCPPVEVIGDYYSKQVKSGELFDWNATCIGMNFDKKEAT